MESDLLPIDHGAIFVDDLPSIVVSTVIVGASDWLSVFELLLHIHHIIAAFHASECSQNEFRFGVGGPGHCTVDAHQPAEVQRPQLSDLCDLRQVVDGDGEVALLDCVLVIVVAICCHKPFESIAQIWLILVE